MSSDPRVDNIYHLAAVAWQQAQIIGLRREINWEHHTEQAIANAKGDPS